MDIIEPGKMHAPAPHYLSKHAPTNQHRGFAYDTAFLLAHDLHEDSFASSAIEFVIENVLPRAKV